MRSPHLLAALAGAALVLVACGSDEPAAPLTISGGETGSAMWFDPDAPEVEAGRYEVTFENVGAVHHELAFVDESGTALAARSIPGASSTTFEVDLSEPGRYEMVCREPGHVAAGMVGTLTAS